MEFPEADGAGEERIQNCGLIPVQCTILGSDGDHRVLRVRMRRDRDTGWADLLRRHPRTPGL